MARLYLVRHAAHDRLGKILAGRMPGVSLSAAGQAQADVLARHFAHVEVAAIVTSPLDRCRQTAAPIAATLGIPITESEALNEIDCGDWTGQGFDTLAEDPRWAAWNAERRRSVIPGGEAAEQVRARATALVERLATEDSGPAIFVTHSDVIKAIVLTQLRGDLDLHDRLDIDPASITTLDLWPGGGKVVRSNEAPRA